MRLELRGITKRFGELTANDQINVVINSGEIHCLLGENGAGKSTLMNVLYGLYGADEGEILLDGVPQEFSGPNDAMAAGIGMLHQHFMLVPTFTVAENVMLGHEPGKAGVLDLAAARKAVLDISESFGFHLNPDAIVENLPVGVQQRVEIIKALSRRADVLILDEPTAVLTPPETDELMAIMRRLRENGTAIVFITHKLREVREAADRITVMRNGRIIQEASPTTTDAELASLMVGRQVELTIHKSAPKFSEGMLRVTNLEVVDSTGMVVVDDVSFNVRGGEVLAIAGVQGNGQTELTEALIGLQRGASGNITLDSYELRGLSVRQILDRGVGFVPEDRRHDGLVGGFTVAENLILNRCDAPPFTKAGSLQLDVCEKFARETVAEYDVRTQSVHTPVQRLSGGNQQKVVLARELKRDLRLLVAAQPTRGVDVGSIEFIHQQILTTRDSGVPVVLATTEIDEAVMIADRIMVMYRGRVVGIVPSHTPRDVLGLMMTGVVPTTFKGAVA